MNALFPSKCLPEWTRTSRISLTAFEAWRTSYGILPVIYTGTEAPPDTFNDTVQDGDHSLYAEGT